MRLTGDLGSVAATDHRGQPAGAWTATVDGPGGPPGLTGPGTGPAPGSVLTVVTVSLA